MANKKSSRKKEPISSYNQPIYDESAVCLSRNHRTQQQHKYTKWKIIQNRVLKIGTVSFSSSSFSSSFPFNNSKLMCWKKWLAHCVTVCFVALRKVNRPYLHWCCCFRWYSIAIYPQTNTSITCIYTKEKSIWPNQ